MEGLGNFGVGSELNFFRRNTLFFGKELVDRCDQVALLKLVRLARPVHPSVEGGEVNSGLFDDLFPKRATLLFRERTVVNVADEGSF